MLLNVKEILPATALIIMVWWNISAVYPRLKLPPVIQKVGWALRLDQAWNMFDEPYTADGWYIIPGKLVNGRTVDVLRGGILNWDKPQRVSRLYHNERWRKFFMTLWQPFMTPLRPRYAAWLCQQWNSRHDNGEALAELEIFFMHEITLLNGTAAPYPERIWQQPCRQVYDILSR